MTEKMTKAEAEKKVRDWAHSDGDGMMSDADEVAEALENG